ncbi:MAG TPA: tetratricopeptide repeat protein [Polyangiaceae bacterium]|nr:tetratricopeptide repeat protein [Polyangiaceae bacterium]
MNRPLIAAALLGAWLAAGPARATPSIWQRARQPSAAAQQTILNRIERLLGSLGLAEFDAELSAGAIALMQLGRLGWPCLPPPGSASGTGPSPAPVLGPEVVLDPRLEYLVGGALLDSHAGREPEARCMLERALRAAPNSPLAARGLADLAIAAAKMGDREAERAAYVRALELTWEPDSRANLLANLAESEMALGDLSRAVRGYRNALSSSQQPELLAGAYFGLAVALDRSGDLPSALEAAKRALAVQLPRRLFAAGNVLDLPNVFFMPSYELHYYKALGAMATAQQAKDDLARRDALADASEQWTRYLVPAEADHARFAPRAALHQASVARQLAEITAKLPKNGRQKPAQDVPLL